MRRSTRCRRCRCSASMRDAAEIAVVVADVRRARRRGAGAPRLRQPAQAAHGRCRTARSSGERDLVGAPVAPQQRHGVELPSPAAARPARGRSNAQPHDAQVSSGPASDGVAQRRLAGRAAIAIGEHGAVDVRDDQVDALERERAERPGLDRAGLARAAASPARRRAPPIGRAMTRAACGSASPRRRPRPRGRAGRARPPRAPP